MKHINQLYPTAPLPMIRSRKSDKYPYTSLLVCKTMEWNFRGNHDREDFVTKKHYKPLVKSPSAGHIRCHL